MGDDWIWFGDKSPKEPGWYATRRCWDPREGIFPDAHYWNGEKWNPRANLSVTYYKTPFDSEDEAREFSVANDPEG